MKQSSILTVGVVFALSLVGAILGALVGAVFLPVSFLDGKIHSVGDILTPQNERDQI
jgi:hypothetical protein